MHAADLSTLMWPEALLYIVDIENMSAPRALKGKTPSADNSADMFTKALGPQRFEKLRERLGVGNVQAVFAVTIE